MIDKSLLKAFGVILMVVGVVGTFFFISYLIAIVNGSVAGSIDDVYTNTSVTGVSFIATNNSYQSLGHRNIVPNSLHIYDDIGNNYSLSNFTVDYTRGMIILN